MLSNLLSRTLSRFQDSDIPISPMASLCNMTSRLLQLGRRSTGPGLQNLAFDKRRLAQVSFKPPDDRGLTRSVKSSPGPRISSLRGENIIRGPGVVNDVVLAWSTPVGKAMVEWFAPRWRPESLTRPLYPNKAERLRQHVPTETPHARRSLVSEALVMARYQLIGELRAATGRSLFLEGGAPY